MKERPILFSAPMVRALLNGSKTQTRRAVKTQPCILGEEFAGPRKSDGFSRAYLMHRAFDRESMASVCPYGQAGDRLWVRETTVNVEEHGYQGPVYAESEDGRCVRDHGLSPDPDDATEVEPEDIKLRPSIFMPRPMCRITLEVINVRVERLQDISHDDAITEGLKGITKDGRTVKYGIPDADGHPGTDDIGWPWRDWHLDARGAYRKLWESINGVGSWDANPWVWAIEFKRAAQ